MKIVITSSGEGLEAQFSPRFGRCANFIFIDTETRVWEAMANPAENSRGGAGPQAVQFIANRNVEAVVSGRFGPSAYAALQAAGIETYIARDDMVDEALDKFLAGQLEEVSQATGGGLHGKGRRS